MKNISLIVSLRNKIKHLCLNEDVKSFLMPEHEMLYMNFYTNFEAFHNNQNEIKVSFTLTRQININHIIVN